MTTWEGTPIDWLTGGTDRLYSPVGAQLIRTFGLVLSPAGMIAASGVAALYTNPALHHRRPGVSVRLHIHTHTPSLYHLSPSAVGSSHPLSPGHPLIKKIKNGVWSLVWWSTRQYKMLLASTGSLPPPLCTTSNANSWTHRVIKVLYHVFSSALVGVVVCSVMVLLVHAW